MDHCRNIFVAFICLFSLSQLSRKPIRHCPVFEFNFGGEDAAFALFSPFPRKLTACTRFGFLENVAFYVQVLWAFAPVLSW